MPFFGRTMGLADLMSYVIVSEKTCTGQNKEVEY